MTLPLTTDASGSTPVQSAPPRTTRVVHVVESFGGGVAAAVQDYVRSTPAASHELLYATRPDAPVSLRDLEVFDHATELPNTHLARIRAVRSSIMSEKNTIAHAHSSFGGVYARLATVSHRGVRVVYTPHCFAFERRDVSLLGRARYLLAEFVLATLTDCYAACSPREATLARRLRRSADVVFVPNVAPEMKQRISANETEPGVPTVVGAGRLGPQKDPLFFRDAIVSLRLAGHRFRARWIGGGDQELTTLLEDAGIEVTGWLSRDGVLAELAGASVYVHSARWEGFPVAVLEVAALGVPIVVRDIPAFESMGFPVVLNSAGDLSDHWPALMTPPSMTAFEERNDALLRQFSQDEQQRALASAYQIGTSQ